MPKYVSLVRKSESLEHPIAHGFKESDLVHNNIYLVGDKKYRCVSVDNLCEWSNQVNHIMQHG